MKSTVFIKNDQINIIGITVCIYHKQFASEILWQRTDIFVWRSKRESAMWRRKDRSMQHSEHITLTSEQREVVILIWFLEIHNCYSLSCCIRNCLKRIGIGLLLSLKVYNIYVSSLLHVYMITWLAFKLSIHYYNNKQLSLK